MFSGFVGGAGVAGIPDRCWSGGRADGGGESGTRADEGICAGEKPGVLAAAGSDCGSSVPANAGSGNSKGCAGVERADEDYVGSGVVARRIADRCDASGRACGRAVGGGECGVGGGVGGGSGG